MDDPKIHPAADIFPLMEGEAFDAMVTDIKANGQREPCVLLMETGELIDGRNRWRAATAAGLVPKTRHWLPDPGQSIVAYVLSLNLHRRHLSESQRAMVAGKIANMAEGRPAKTVPISTVSEPHVSAEQAAEMLNVGRNTVFTAKRVLAKAVPELIQAVEKGDVSVNIADKVSRLEPEQQREAVRERAENPSARGRPSVSAEKKAKPEPQPEKWVTVSRASSGRLLELIQAVADHVSKPSMQVSFIDLRQQVAAAQDAAREMLAAE